MPIGPMAVVYVSSFKRTPASLDDKPVPASEVNLVGKLTGDISVLKKIASGDKITVMKNDN